MISRVVRSLPDPKWIDSTLSAERSWLNHESTAVLWQRLEFSWILSGSNKEHVLCSKIIHSYYQNAIAKCGGNLANGASITLKESIATFKGRGLIMYLNTTGINHYQTMRSDVSRHLCTTPPNRSLIVAAKVPRGSDSTFNWCSPVCEQDEIIMAGEQKGK